MNHQSLAIRIAARAGLVLWSMLFLTVGALMGVGF